MQDAKDLYAQAATELAEIDGQIASLEKRRIVLRQFVDLGQKLYGSAELRLPMLTLEASGGPQLKPAAPSGNSTSREK